MMGQPPDPKQIEPLQKTLSSPSMADIVGKIREDATRTFVINIQTNSTIDLDSSQDKAEVGEFMNAMGQLLAGIQPLMALGPSGVEATKILLISVCQRFKFGMDAADAIGQIQPPQPESPEQKGPPPPTPEETAALQAETQYRMAKVNADMQILAAETELALAEIQAKKQKLSLDIQGAELTLAAKRNKMQTDKANQNANV